MRDRERQTAPKRRGLRAVRAAVGKRSRKRFFGVFGGGGVVLSCASSSRRTKGIWGRSTERAERRGGGAVIFALPVAVFLGAPRAPSHPGAQNARG